ncbi:hemin-degrading factor [Marinobacter salicampi]|uniref:hemin-degrading factor n=1 Tax=Marinobacter salicampi TaxID=435907 RepID=UPI00140A47D9|nr:ChuX/HutX family heme-like substrate-binding protein [Marinobacter salicampi]
MEQAVSQSTRTAADAELTSRWENLRAEQPQLRIRQAASLLGVSERDLLLCRPAEALKRLRPEFGDILTAMESVGEVMVLARNEQVVHEVTGQFQNFRVSSSGVMGLAVGNVDVRVFFRHWTEGYWVREEVRSGIRESLQFFDPWGMPVQKIYRVEKTDPGAWQSLVQRFTDHDLARRGQQKQRKKGVRPVPARTDSATVDVESLRRGWADLKDVHHFNALLQDHKVDRLTALEMIGADWARRLADAVSATGKAEKTSPLDTLLEQVRDAQCPIMVFVGNVGIVQIHTGVPANVRRMGDWLNILDPGFNLHANTSGIAHWWIIRRPSSDGIITSVEGFNEAGELVLTLFGHRKPGQSEDTTWQAEVKRLEERLCP